jgi:DNA-binding transcriptional LysR family regulator
MIIEPDRWRSDGASANTAKMELRQLITFRRVANTLSFTQAAAELNYAQSTVTAHVKALESDLHVALFERLGQRVLLTDAGRQLLPYAERIADLADEARQVITRPEEPIGDLIIGTIESVTSYRLPVLLERFHHRYPKVRLHLRTAPCFDTARSLLSGELDVGFLMEEKADHPGLVTVRLCEEELVVVAAPHHPLVHAEGVTEQDLSSANVLVVESGCSYRDLFEAELQEAGVDPIPTLEFGTTEAIKRSVRTGLGISLLPEITVVEELAAGELAIVPWRVPFQVSTQLAWHREKWMSRVLKTFIAEAQRAIGEH